jgi:hypothetical protein
MPRITRILLVSSLALLASYHHRSNGGWTCEWTDGPRTTSQSSAACTGFVSCSHESMQTFLPQIRRVSCPKSNGACDATACFVDAIRPK